MGCQLNDLIEDYKELSPKEARTLLRKIEELQELIQDNAEATHRLAYAIEAQKNNKLKHNTSGL